MAGVTLRQLPLKSLTAFTRHASIRRTSLLSTLSTEPRASFHATIRSMGLDGWKNRAPYSIYKPGEDFEAIYEGSCHCGKVTYQLSRERPLASKYCHCTTCQQLHGAPFQWAAIFHKEDINFTNGHHDLVWYESSEKTTKHTLPCKVTCGYCRSPIMDEGRNMILLFPSLIHFKGKREDMEKFAPTCHMFYGQRVVDIPDGKPKWTGLDGKSELMEEGAEHQKDAKKRKLAHEPEQETEEASANS